MKYIIGLFLIINLFSCKQSQDVAKSKVSKKSVQLKLIEAKSQKWHGGAPGSGSGFYYYFLFKRPKQEVNFDSVWIDDKVYRLVKLDGKFDTFTTEEVITVQAIANPKPNTPVIEILPSLETNEPPLPKETPKMKAPISYEGKALVRYYINGAEFYTIVKDIQTMQPLFYPSISK